jgi:hypothetical protein
LVKSPQCTSTSPSGIFFILYFIVNKGEAEKPDAGNRKREAGDRTGNAKREIGTGNGKREMENGNGKQEPGTVNRKWEGSDEQ